MTIVVVDAIAFNVFLIIPRMYTWHCDPAPNVRIYLADRITRHKMPKLNCQSPPNSARVIYFL